MSSPIAPLAIALAICLLVTPLATAAIYRFSKSLKSAMLLGGISVPTLLFMSLVYDLSTLEVDSPPPGMIIIGGLIGLAIVTSITMIVSFLTSRALHKKNVR